MAGKKLPEFIEILYYYVQNRDRLCLAASCHEVVFASPGGWIGVFILRNSCLGGNVQVDGLNFDVIIKLSK
jgi:hypothetical protein